MSDEGKKHVDPELKKMLTRILLENHMGNDSAPVRLDILIRKAEDAIREAKLAQARKAAQAPAPNPIFLDELAAMPPTPAPLRLSSPTLVDWGTEGAAITSAVLTRPEVEAILSALYAMRVELLREQRKVPDSTGYKELLATNDAAIRKMNGLRVPSGGHISFED